MDSFYYMDGNQGPVHCLTFHEDTSVISPPMHAIQEKDDQIGLSNRA
jgi:hypothetical protein